VTMAPSTPTPRPPARERRGSAEPRRTARPAACRRRGCSPRPGRRRGRGWSGPVFHSRQPPTRFQGVAHVKGGRTHGDAHAMTLEVLADQVDGLDQRGAVHLQQAGADRLPRDRVEQGRRGDHVRHGRHRDVGGAAVRRDAGEHARECGAHFVDLIGVASASVTGAGSELGRLTVREAKCSRDFRGEKAEASFETISVRTLGWKILVVLGRTL